MEFVQDLLTAATQIIALAGFGGIFGYAAFKQHAKTAAIYAEVPAPQIEPDTQADKGVDTTLESPDIPSHQETIAEDIWDSGIATSAPRYWVRRESQPTKPLLMLAATKAETKPAAPTRTAIKKSQNPLELNLSALDSATLRKLCSQHGIQWRDARGKGKHLTKAAMVFQLEQKATA